MATLLVLTGSPALPALRAQAPAAVAEQASPDRLRQEARRAARLTVSVPHEDTVLSLDGQAIVGAGTTRVVETPPLRPRERRRFTLTASWNPNTYTTITRTKSVSVRAGESVAVDLTREDPGDRVRVIYVPTPSDVAEEMVAPAGVTAADVVFEPGCGDARAPSPRSRPGPGAPSVWTSTPSARRRPATTSGRRASQTGLTCARVMRWTSRTCRRSASSSSTWAITSTC
ncbi:MAG: TIGR03000 domain-containing protein [Acidobacteria bacterium]|nr:TIGR03000 domain-containing protein [Acidobacteriota bacterium]